MKFSKISKVYFYSFFTLLFAALFSGIALLYVNGPINLDAVADLHESNTIFESIKDHKEIKKVRSEVFNDNSRNAIKRLDKLKQNTQLVSKIMDNEEIFETLETDFIKTRKSINQIISLPELKSILVVLLKKMERFEGFVTQNKWRTLTRLSNRNKVRTVNLNKLNITKLAPGRILKVFSAVKKDIHTMKNITKGSILSTVNKQKILGRLETLSVEISMISQYAKDLARVSKDIKTFDEAFSTWANQISPQMALKRINMEKDSKVLAWSIYGLLIFVVLAFLLGIKILSLNERANHKKVEQFTLAAIKDSLLPIKMNRELEMSKSSQNSFEQLRQYVQKRMSFGSLFNKAMPFPSIMLDSNLNIIWGNELFYDLCKISKSSDTTISWDFFQGMTNLGASDPLHNALHDNVAGIYQIQIRKDDSGEGLPFEMYVTPVDDNEKKRIMVFFYPLKSIEESIAEQITSIVGPITKSLDALRKQEFNLDFQKNAKKDFEVAGIGQIFEKFEEYSETTSQHQEHLHQDIGNLENQLFDGQKLLKDLTSIMNEEKDTLHSLVDKFEALKEAIIMSVDTRVELTQLKENALAVTNEVISAHKNIIHSLYMDSEKKNEGIKAFSGVVKLRTRLKELREAGQKFAPSGRGSQELGTYLLELNDLLKKFDLSISRIELTMQGSENFELDVALRPVEELLDSLNAVKESIYHKEEKIAQLEDNLVAKLKEQFMIIKSIRTNNNNGMKLLNNSLGPQIAEMTISAQTDGSSVILN
jgi:hypothetical protein